LQVAASEAAGQSLMTAAGVSGIPCALVVDRKGIVRFCGHPADPGFESSVRTVRVGALSPGSWVHERQAVQIQVAPGLAKGF